MIGRFIARGMHAYNVVEEAGFLDLMDCAMPDCVVLSRTTFSRAFIPELYKSEKKGGEKGAWGDLCQQSKVPLSHNRQLDLT